MSEERVMSSQLVRDLVVVAVAVGLGACKGSKTETGAAQATGSQPAAKQPAGLPGQPEADLSAVVATIDGRPITVAELQDRLNKQSPYVRARYTSLEQKKEFLDNYVRFESMAAEAQKRGFDKDPEVVRTTKQVMIQRFLRDEFENKFKPDDISDDEAKKNYDEHLADFNKPEEVRVSAIVVKDKAKAQKVTAEAKLPANADNKAFRDLVTKYSEDEESKTRGGDLRFFAADAKTLPAEVVKAAFELKNQGELSPPVSTANGFYILKQTGSRKAISKSFDDVKQQIKNKLLRDKKQKAMQDFEADLKKKAKVEIHEDALAKVRVDTAQTPPQPGAPGATPELAEPGAPPPGKPPGPGAPPPPGANALQVAPPAAPAPANPPAK
jgi:peptidyl-prolyl cis-trans isomerase C